MPLVSVIMPAYNAEKTIADSIDSVINQTFSDWELIVINDCSKDNTKNIIFEKAKDDSRIIVLDNSSNSGVSYSRNKGISQAKGEWIAFLDSDDMWRSDKLKKQLDLVEKYPDAVLTYTASSFINYDGVPYEYILPAEEKVTYSTLLKRNILSCSSVMIKSSIMKTLEMPTDKIHEDYYIWLNVLKKEKYAYGVNEPLLIYRLSNHSKSSNRIKSGIMVYRTYRWVGYMSIAAFILTLRYSIHSISKRYKIKK